MILLLLAGVLLLGLLALLALDFPWGVTFSHGNDVINQSVTITTDADGKVYSELTVGAAATVGWDGLTGLASKMKAYCFLPTFAGTMTVNYASGADDVITLVANEPVAWHNKMQLTNHFVNVNAITTIDFASTADAGTVKILIARDSTP